MFILGTLETWLQCPLASVSDNSIFPGFQQRSQSRTVCNDPSTCIKYRLIQLPRSEGFLLQLTCNRLKLSILAIVPIKVQCILNNSKERLLSFPGRVLASITRLFVSRLILSRLGASLFCRRRKKKSILSAAGISFYHPLIESRPFYSPLVRL